MSLLTRVFVLLVAVLSIILVAMIVPFVVNTDNYKAQAAGLKQERDAAVLLAQSRQTELTNATDNASKESALLTARATAAEARLNAVIQQLRGSEQDLAKARANIDQLTAANRQHAAAAEQASALIASLTTELGTRREEVTRLSTQYIQAADRIAELEEQSRTLNRSVRNLQEMLATANAEAQGNEARGAASATAGTGAGAGEVSPGPNAGFQAPHLIQGQISRVESVEGDTLVQINVGQADGVQQNMRFMIARGDQYIGTMVVSMVDERSAAGRMRLQQGAPQTGDTVVSGQQ